MKRREYLASHLGLVVRLGTPPAALALGGCMARGERVAVIEGATMGTAYRVSAVVDAGEVDALEDDVAAIVGQIDGLMSTYRPESELSRFNASDGTGWVEVSADTHAVLAAAHRTAAVTGGSFDATVGPLVDLWGFGPSGSRRALPAERDLADVRSRIGSEHLEPARDRHAVRKTLAGLHVDLSGIAKGYGVDRVAGRLDVAGVEHYLVDIGGELRARGRKPDGTPWRIGIERPSAGRRVPLTVIGLEDRAVATSGDYRNFFDLGGRRYSHAIDPVTGRPVEHTLASVSVVADTAMEADALSTALMVMGPERGYEHARSAGAAALFLVREPDGFRQIATPEFEPLRQPV